jgi:EmrB/QacA subfamily drug resistance transporter
MGAFDSFATNVALPHIGSDFHASIQGLQWVSDAYVLGAAAFILTAGALGDRFGRKRTFQLGQLLFVLASFACSVAPSIGMLIAFRALQALGFACLMPSSLAIITNLFDDPRERAKAIGFWSATGGFGVAAGPVLGGILVNYISWRGIFWVNIPIGIIAMGFTRRYVRSSGEVTMRRLDPAGQVLAVASLAVLVYALIEGPDKGWSSPLILGLFAASLILFAVFIRVERVVKEPLIELGVFKIPSVSGAAYSGFVGFAVLNGFLFANTLLLQDIRGLSPIRTGLAMLPATVMMTITPRISGRLTGRYGPRRPIVISLVSFGLGEIGLLLSGSSTPIWLLALPFMLHGIALGFLSPPLTVAAVEAMPVERAGVASGIVLTARQVGSALGLALLGSVVTNVLYGSLRNNLHSGGITGSHADAIINAVHAGRFSNFAIPASLAAPAHTIVAHTFIDGSHWENITALVLICTALAVAIPTMHRRSARGTRPDVAEVAAVEF